VRWQSAAACAVLSAVTFVSGSGVANNVSPDPNAKQPWEWTSAERAQARRDPEKRIERVHAYQSNSRPSRTSSSALSYPNFPPVGDVIDGSRNPELYFVTELFEILVRSSFVTLPAAYPKVVRQRTSDLFKDGADWDRFVAIVAEYADVLKGEKTAAAALSKTGVTEIQARKCAAAARALQESRRTFGPIRFDRMLYETVPRSMRTTFSIDTDFEKSIGDALEREGRCQ
jgi:hypothetical protein